MNAEEKEKDQRATKALVFSEGFEFAGIEMEGVTSRRLVAASVMGMKWPDVTDEDQITDTFEIDAPVAPKKKSGVAKKEKQKFTLTHYRGSYQDCVFIYWLCHQPLSAVIRACRKPDDAAEEAHAWAEKKGLILGTELWWQGLRLWLEITTQIVEHRSKPESNKPGGKGPDKLPDDSGEL